MSRFKQYLSHALKIRRLPVDVRGRLTYALSKTKIDIETKLN